MKTTENIFKIVLSLLLLGCLAPLPYGYFQVVRFASAAGFCWFAYLENERGSKTMMIAWIALAALFQPLLKIALGRQIWNIVDVVVAIGLIISILLVQKTTKNS